MTTIFRGGKEENQREKGMGRRQDSIEEIEGGCGSKRKNTLETFGNVIRGLEEEQRLGKV